MEISGKIIAILPLQSGVGKNGTEWKKQEYVIETDEEFDETKLMGIYATIDDLDEFNSYLTGLFYDGKLLSLHQSACDDGNGSVNNHIVRYKEGEYGLIIDKAFPELD